MGSCAGEGISVAEVDDPLQDQKIIKREWNGIGNRFLLHSSRPKMPRATDGLSDANIVGKCETPREEMRGFRANILWGL